MALRRLLLRFRYGERGAFAAFEEPLGLVAGVEPRRQFGFEQHFVRIFGGMELRHDAEVGRRPEGDDFAFAFDQQPDGYALYAAGRERRPHLLPQHGREFEAHQTVQYAARLLRVDEVHVDRAGILDGFEDRPFGDFVENDALRLIDREAQHFGQVPCDSLAFAVFIGCEPHAFRVAGQLRK